MLFALNISAISEQSLEYMGYISSVIRGIIWNQNRYSVFSVSITCGLNSWKNTGIGIIPRNDVVSATLEKRELPHAREIPEDWYVLEDTNIDSIVIWQSSKWLVYMETPGKIKQICSSMVEYILNY